MKKKVAGAQSSEDEKPDVLEHLPEHEKDILKRQLDIQQKPIGYFALYRFASRSDLAIVALGAVASIIGGALLPIFTIIFGQLTGTFRDYFNNNTSKADFNKQLNKYTLYFVYLAIAQFISLYIGTVASIYAGESVTRKTRENYLRAILRQNIGFFDRLGAGEVTTRITSDTNLIQEGVSQKLTITLQSLSTFITAFVIGFVRYWKLTIILFSTVIAITLDFGIGSTFLVKWTEKALTAYANGGTVAEETFSSIRNAISFGTQNKLLRQYEKHLIEAERWGIKGRAALACMIGAMFAFIFWNYGLAFWMGSRFVADGVTDISAVVTVLIAVVFGAFGLGTVGPNIQAFSSAVASAQKIYGTIDRKSPLDPESEDGETLNEVVGDITLENIKLIYPSRPEVTTLEDINLHVPAGKTTAIVGESGSGKSSIIGLIERFYDPVGGVIRLDKHDLLKLNIRWLRQQMALVSQEPVLFAVSVFDNIRYGLIGSPMEDASAEKVAELVYDAARMANAHDFIQALPEGYNTNVGERGFLMSGGQKQRIAIARAIISDPKILLLDEATSALDTKSEGVVQAALERASKGRTTIVIAHRLSTIRDADNIVVMAEGRIVEQGLHSALIDKQGAYSKLVFAQQIAAAATRTTDHDETDGPEEIAEGTYNSSADGNTEGRAVAPEDIDLETKLKRTQSRKSESSVALDKRTTPKLPEYSLITLIRFIFIFNKKEWMLLILGFALCVLAGGGNPAQAVIFGQCIQALSLPPNRADELRSSASYWSRWFLILGFLMFIAYAGQLATFGYCAEKLTHRARHESFRRLLRQEMGFFDREENSAGALTSFLSTEAMALEGISGSTLGSFVTLLVTVVAALAVGIAYGWKLGLVCGATLPILLAAGFFRYWVLEREVGRAKAAYSKSASYACEATSAIRTVASLNREKDVLNTYHQQVMAQSARSFRSVARSSLLYAASESLVLLVAALGFWYGGHRIASGEYTILQFFVTFSAIVFGAQSAGTSFSFAPDLSKAIQAGVTLKRLYDRTPEIDVWSEEGAVLSDVEGRVEIRDVHFRYPTRPEQPVLRGLDLEAKPGQYIALVGPSGCGKSTVISLVERFYDVLSGGIYVDGQNITGLNLREYRKHLALVSQEPALYQGTIRDNILLGTELDDVPEESIIRVCKEANIYKFITSLPEGFNTPCGSKGTLLSGGQKQRIAIARALLRDPKVLLLDEATSALDSESEKVVQEALDAAAKGRTTIAIAHRLSTIQNADMIYVLDGGVVAEQGRHGELLARRGRYYELVQLQNLDKSVT